MEMKEFENLEQLIDEEYPYVNKYKVNDDSNFFIEGAFYTQLTYIKDHFLDRYNEIINEIIDTTKRNKLVVFTGDFENPIVKKENYVYRELEDVLALLKLSFDNKGNPDSDWKD